jgi:hypothetical protein
MSRQSQTTQDKRKNFFKSMTLAPRPKKVGLNGPIGRRRWPSAYLISTPSANESFAASITESETSNYHEMVNY